MVDRWPCSISFVSVYSLYKHCFFILEFTSVLAEQCRIYLYSYAIYGSCLLTLYSFCLSILSIPLYLQTGNLLSYKHGMTDMCMFCVKNMLEAINLPLGWLLFPLWLVNNWTRLWTKGVSILGVEFDWMEYYVPLYFVRQLDSLH